MQMATDSQTKNGKAEAPVWPVAPSGPQLERPKPPKLGAPNPWLVLVSAFAVGCLLAKAIDWRGYAHPRRR